MRFSCPLSLPSLIFLFFSASSPKLGPLVTTGVWNCSGLGSMLSRLKLSQL